MKQLPIFSIEKQISSLNCIDRNVQVYILKKWFQYTKNVYSSMKIEIEFQMNRIKGVNSKLIFIWSIDSKFVIQCGLIQCLATFNFS